MVAIAPTAIAPAQGQPTAATSIAPARITTKPIKGNRPPPVPVQNVTPGKANPQNPGTVPSQPNNQVPQPGSLPAGQPGPAIYYPFNGDYRDYSGNNFHGTPFGGTAFANEGVDGESVVFDGANGYVSSARFYWMPGGATTAMFWMKLGKSEVKNAVVLGVGPYESPNRFLAAPWSDGKLYWDYGTHTNGRASADYKPYLDKWTHVALVLEGKNGAYKAIYLDGELAASGTLSDSPDGVLNGISVGRGFAGQWNYYKGLIDEFSIYNTVLSPEQVKQIYGEQKNRLTQGAKAPITRPIPDKEVNARTGAQQKLVSLWDYVYDDIDSNEKLSFFFSQSDPSLIGCFIETIEGKKYVSCGAPAKREGKSTISLTIKNTGGKSAQSSFTIFVKFSPNTPPKISALPDITVKANSGELGKFMDLQLYASDNETPARELTFGIGQSNSALIACFIEEDKADKKKFVSCAAPAKNMGGASTVTILARDKDGAEASASFTITVEGPVNNAPVCRLEGIGFDEHDKSKEVVLKVGGSDADGDSLAEASVQWGDGLTNGQLKPSSLPMEFRHTYTGNVDSYTIRFTVTDSRGLKSNECTWPVSFFPAPAKACTVSKYCSDDKKTVEQKNADCSTTALKTCSQNETCSNAECIAQSIFTPCTTHSTYSCSNNDVYWQNSCKEKEDRKEACGESYCEDYGATYCKGNSVYKKRACFNKGCALGACYSNEAPEEALAQECNQFTQTCEQGECKQRKSCNEEWICENNKTSSFMRADCSPGIREPCQHGCTNSMCNLAPGIEPKPNSSYACISGDVYWFDYYGNRGKKKQECGTHACNSNRCEGIDSPCSQHNYYACSNSDVYWFNACGAKEDKKETCTNGCYDTACKLPPPDPKPGNQTGIIYNTKDRLQCVAGDSWWFDSKGNATESNQDCQGKGCTNGACNSTSGSKDSDGDGFDDEEENLIGSDAQNMSSTPFTVLSGYSASSFLRDRSGLFGLLNQKPISGSTIAKKDTISRNGARICGFFSGIVDGVAIDLIADPVVSLTQAAAFLWANADNLDRVAKAVDSLFSGLASLPGADQKKINEYHVNKLALRAEEVIKSGRSGQSCTPKNEEDKKLFRGTYVVGSTFTGLALLVYAPESKAADIQKAGKEAMETGKLLEQGGKLIKTETTLTRLSAEASEGLALITQKTSATVAEQLMKEGTTKVGQGLVEKGLIGLSKLNKKNINGVDVMAKRIADNVSRPESGLRGALTEPIHVNKLIEKGYNVEAVAEQFNNAGTTFLEVESRGPTFVHEAKSITKDTLSIRDNANSVDSWLQENIVSEMDRLQAAKQNIAFTTKLWSVDTFVFTLPKDTLDAFVYSKGKTFSELAKEAIARGAKGKSFKGVLEPM